MGSAATATVSIQLQSEGLYRGLEVHPQTDGSQVPHTIHHADGEDVVMVDQRFGADQGSLLGTSRFAASTPSAVRLVDGPDGVGVRQRIWMIDSEPPGHFLDGRHLTATGNPMSSRPRVQGSMLRGLLAICVAAHLAACGTEDEGGGPADPGTSLPVRFRLPVINTEGMLLSFMVIGVDHDPEDRGGLGWECVAYDGAQNFPRCYDQHTGTDYVLNGGFATMDAEVAWVVAAADGVVVDAQDGNYDRCHTDIETQEIDCDGHPMEANYVIVEHAEGIRTWYWHLKKDTLLVAEGTTVLCGQKLALIGSSGVSMQPHVHFEVRDAEQTVIDPYAGVASQPESYWLQQDGLYGLPTELCPTKK